MSHTVPIIERAFQLAQSGEYSTLESVRKQLKAEGYSLNHLDGRALTKQLRELIKATLAKVAQS